jgi:hypothetical protein
MSTKQTFAHMQLCVFASDAKQRSFNIETFEGVDNELSAYGFTKKGLPIFDKEARCEIKLSGPMIGAVNLNQPFNSGIRLPHQRDANRKLIVSPKVKGYAAVYEMLARNGCQPPKIAEIQEKIEALIKNGVSTIYFYKLSSTQGLASAVGNKDEWIITGESPKINFEFVNNLLKKLKSPWRIVTDKTLRMLRVQELKRLI